MLLSGLNMLRKKYDLSPFDHLNISHFNDYVISPTADMFMLFVLQVWISTFYFNAET